MKIGHDPGTKDNRRTWFHKVSWSVRLIVDKVIAKIMREKVQVPWTWSFCNFWVTCEMERVGRIQFERVRQHPKTDTGTCSIIQVQTCVKYTSNHEWKFAINWSLREKIPFHCLSNINAKKCWNPVALNPCYKFSFYVLETLSFSVYGYSNLWWYFPVALTELLHFICCHWWRDNNAIVSMAYMDPY